MRNVFRWTTALYLSCASTVALAGALPGAGSFSVGYNEAWFAERYGVDLTSGFDPNFVAKMFDGMARGGATIVRIMPFTNLQGIQLRAYAPQTQGLGAAFVTNLKTVLSLARARQLKVYITVLEGNEFRYASGSRRDYFWNLISNDFGERDAFKANVMAPLLIDVLNQNRDVIYALDLMNEIEAPLNSNYFPSYWIGARNWMRDMAAFVKAKSPWLAVTSTAGWGYAVQELTLGLFSGIGLDYYDVHVYSDSGQYPGMSALCSKARSDAVPIILGEYGQKSQTISDYIQYFATGNFLYGAKTSCFSSALAWKYETSQLWFTYLKPDGTFRPAYYVIQAFGTPH